jgi:hypothetical protein
VAKGCPVSVALDDLRRNALLNRSVVQVSDRLNPKMDSAAVPSQRNHT